MARPVAYPESIEPLVRFVEETPPEHIVARTHDRLAAGTPVKDVLLASALAVVRSSDLPPGHHGGPLHPLAGLHAVRHIAARLPGEYARLPVIQNVAVANKHIHSPAMGPFILPDAQPVSEQASVEATLESFRMAASRGVYHACDHYYLYLLQRLSPMQVLEHLLHVAIPKNQLDDHYFLFPVFTWRALEYLGWEYARYIGRAPVRYVTRPTADASLEEVDGLIGQYELFERDLRVETGEDETAAITALADDIGRCSQFDEIPEMLAPALQPEPERVASLPLRTQEALLDEIATLIGSLPVGERLPAANIATWRSTDEVKQAAALAQQYADHGYAPEPLITVLGKIACRDNFTEMHALKHHQATYEEFHATRPSLRWRHLVAAVQAAAISHGRIQDIYEHAAEVMHF